MSRFSLDDYIANSPGLSVEAIETLADYAGIGLFNLHIPTGEISLNRNITLLTGYEPGDLPHTGNTKEALTYEQDRAMVMETMQSVLSGETDRYQIEYRMRRVDGSLVWVSETAIVYERDAAGNPTRIAALATDLTRLKWAEDKARMIERDMQQLSADTHNESLAEQNRMLRASNMASYIIIGGFHQSYDTVLTKSLQSLAESVRADRAYFYRNIVADGKLLAYPRIEWSLHTPSGREMGPKCALGYASLLPQWQEVDTRRIIRARLGPDTAETILLPHMDDVKTTMLIPLTLQGEFWGFIGFDNTESDRMFSVDEADIMAVGSLVLASSITRNETFSQLNKAREDALSSTKAKGEFLSRMSHEIRTPMNAIIGMTNIAKKSSDPDKIKHCLDKIDASSRQLLAIINDVLDMSKIESGKFDITPVPFDFEQMTQSILDVIQVKLDEKRQQLHLDFDTVFQKKMCSDELRLSQVLTNLLNNAVKFTPEGGDITLRIREKPNGPDGCILHVEVADNGIGISPEQQSRLFQSFEQADGSITRQYGGTGLGLAICKKIIGLMGGTIWVESELGHGARFRFEVPITWGEPIPAIHVLKRVSPTSRILVVDDSEDVLEYFQSILDSFSLSCNTAASGAQALSLVRKSLQEKRPYSMVFIDWNMPDMNGGATAQQLRSLLGDDLIVIMISSADWSDIEQQVKEYGITHFLPKPILPSTLYNMIVKLTDDSMIRPSALDDRPADDWHGKTILLAEDIEINREIIITILDGTGVAIVSAENGKEALELVTAEPSRYDLILMDMQMPVLDGIAATQQIRALPHPAAKTVPIIAMTANAFQEDAQRCLDAGMNGHLAKPLDVDAFFQMLHTYLS
ncbi:MAG: response regulator [Klebsiella quasipneumoniae]|nr:response regulator [Klebsiella quasipneumoniae]